MKKFLIPILAVLILGAASYGTYVLLQDDSTESGDETSSPTWTNRIDEDKSTLPELDDGPPVSRQSLQRPEDPQIGLNFIRFFMEEQGIHTPSEAPDPGTLYYDVEEHQPAWIFNDFEELGIHTFRQMTKGDFGWDSIQLSEEEWNFEGADAVVTNPDFEPIVTLFSLQYASPTPPWETQPEAFQKELGPDAEEYLETLIDRYGEYVTYWEIGNEMDHWRAADPGENPAEKENGLPESYPLDGFSPQEQGVFMKQVAEFIRERDDDAVIVLPGMSSIDFYVLDTWFAGVIEGAGGTDWFDIVNYHYYSSWEDYLQERNRLQAFIEKHEIQDKEVWLTETGSTASETLTKRTNYPNSEITQAADVFRRLLQAYEAGDDMVMWHTYIGSPDREDNMWRLYGVRESDSTPEFSYYALQLFIEELIPFDTIEAVSKNPLELMHYKIVTKEGEERHVAWGRGRLTVPEGMTEMTSVVPGVDQEYPWTPVRSGETLVIGETPVILR